MIGRVVAAIGVAIWALAACGATREPAAAVEYFPMAVPAPDVYLDRVHGAWATTMVANHSGLPIEGRWIEDSGPPGAFELVLLDQWSTDDDTHVEWLTLHILETHGEHPSWQAIRDEWVDHLNGDIWVATSAARALMDEGVVPPATGVPPANPDAGWSMDAQLENELFGLLYPGDPVAARLQARRFAQITNRGPAVDASAFYADLYASAFAPLEVDELIERARARESQGSLVAPIVDDVMEWHSLDEDWRSTRRRIAERYDTDPAFWASRLNFAVTIMALLYGDGDLDATVEIAALAGWDADNNMTTAAGLLGVIVGHDELPEPWSSATDVYFNEDLTNLPRFDSVRAIAERTVALGRAFEAASPP